MKNSQRKLSVYEKNQLLKYQKNEADFLEKEEMPVEYFTGFVEFRDLDLVVNQNVLIPRVETEELVDLLLDNYSNFDGFSYLELGTGSGAISLSFLKELMKKDKKLPEQIILTDFSEQALEVAQENFSRHFNSSFLAKIKFLQENLTAGIEKKQFDFVVANLPYIPDGEISQLDSSVRDFEPHLALVGGKTGFELIAQLLNELLEKALLKENAKVFLEVDHSHGQNFIEKNYPQFLERFKIKFIKDQFDRNRFLILEQV